MQVGQVFMIIFAIIVMGFVLYFGFLNTQNILCLGDTGSTNNMINNLASLVDDIQASGEGSRDLFAVALPSTAKVCFINPGDPRPHISGNWIPESEMYPIIEKRIQTGGFNVWIDYTCAGPEPGYSMDYIVLSADDRKGNFCVESGDSILLTNIGIEVLIEKYVG